MAGPPQRSSEDRALALQKAALARKVRAELREDLRMGRVTLVDVLERTGDDHIGGIKVKAILTALPGLGKVKSYRLMERLGIADNRRLRGLGPHQRQALLDALT